MVRIVFGLGNVTAGRWPLCSCRSTRVEAIVLPAIVLGLVTFGVALYSRARYRREWSAAWDAYAAERSSRRAESA